MPAVQDLRADTGERQTAVTVIPSDEIGRGSFGAVHLENLALTRGLVHVRGMDEDAISDLCLHGASQSEWTSRLRLTDRR